MITRVEGAYEWLEADYNLPEFVRLCPGAVEGKYLAITSRDSGIFIPSGADIAAGWRTAGGSHTARVFDQLEICPMTASAGIAALLTNGMCSNLRRKLELCRDNVFTAEIAPGSVFAFVKYYFCPSDPKFQPITNLFWKQIEWMQPESYIADGSDCLIFATRDKTLFASVHAALESNPAS